MKRFNNPRIRPVLIVTCDIIRKTLHFPVRILSVGSFFLQFITLSNARALLLVSSRIFADNGNDGLQQRSD